MVGDSVLFVYELRANKYRIYPHGETNKEHGKEEQTNNYIAVISNETSRPV